MRAPSEKPSPIPAFERRTAGFILLGFLLVISLPYLIAPLIFPSNVVWGGLLGSADDQNVHLMWARQARDGAFFFRDQFTTEGLISGERALFFNILPALMGWLSRLTTLDVVFPYHFLRVALAGWALWQFHQLALAATNNEEKWSRARILSLFLIAFSTGAGILASVPGFSRFIFIDRPDVNFPLMPEAFFALSAFAYPLNIASFGLLALIFRKVIEKQDAPIAFVAALLLSNIHTYDALPLILTLVIWLGWKRSGAATVGAAIVGALIPIGYQFLVFRGSEEFRIKALTLTLPPDILSLLLSFAPLLILAAFGYKKWRELPATALLLIWTIATFVLVYAPVFSFARKMLEGVQIPLVLLAGVGLSELLSKIAAAPARKTAAAGVLGVLALSPLYYLGWIWNNTVENNASRIGVFMPPLALSRGDADALKAISAQPDQGVVLCFPYVGSYVPRSTGKFTYAGHWAETLHFFDKEHPEFAKFPQVLRFYNGGMSSEEALKFLKDNKIRWVIDGQYEKGAAQGLSVARSLGLSPIFTGGDAQNGNTTVYAVPAA
ncbi:hypothetical protein EON80_07465 [bacterium]|nr:MAG: hypothetical protein EON80_07465 [bacterium]